MPVFRIDNFTSSIRLGYLINTNFKNDKTETSNSFSLYLTSNLKFLSMLRKNAYKLGDI